MMVFFGLLSARLVIDHYHAQAHSAATPTPTTRQNQPEKFILKNDPQCGIPNGGTNCELDCERAGDLYKDPACLRDCLTPTCFALLMKDHAKHNGVCTGSYGSTEYNWQVSNSKCQTEEIKDCECCPVKKVEVTEGLCSKKTVSALIQGRVQ